MNDRFFSGHARPTAHVFLRRMWQRLPAPHIPSQIPSMPRKSSAAASSPDPELPRAFGRVDVEAELCAASFGPIQKSGTAYAARLHRPLLVQTPPVTVLSALEDDVAHVHLKVAPRSRLGDFLERVEDRLLSTCLESKATWFPRTVDDDVLRASFKSFFRAGALKVRVPRDVLLFDEAGQLVGREAAAPGTSVRCLLELSRVTFGRTEFGAMWTLVQAQVAPPPPPPPAPAPSPPKCLIDPSLALGDDDHAADHAAADHAAPADHTAEEDEVGELGDELLGDELSGDDGAGGP